MTTPFKTTLFNKKMSIQSTKQPIAPSIKLNFKDCNYNSDCGSRNDDRQQPEI